MTWQSAARGALLRPLHFGASTRPNAMIGLQNQLRCLSLATNVRQALPQLQKIPAIQSLSQSNSFATDVSPKAKKPKAKADKEKPAKSRSTKKKPLSEKQVEAKKAREHREHIKQLKETALELPKRLSENYYNLALVDKINEIKGQYPPGTESLKMAAQLIKPVPNESGYRAQAEENKATNKATFEQWLKSYTPIQIKQANNARIALVRIEGRPHNKRWPLIQDERLVRKPYTGYNIYCMEQMNTGDNQHMGARERISSLGKEWNALSEAEKEYYNKKSAEDRVRYDREHQEAYGTPAPPSRTAASSSVDL